MVVSVNPKPKNSQCHNVIILNTLGCNMTIVAKNMTTEHTINAFMKKQKDQTMSLLAQHRGRRLYIGVRF
jgi:hypothetical protein